MGERIPLSVFLIARDEEERIGDVIRSVAEWVDEVIVVDSGSTDRTVEVAKEAGASAVLTREWEGYGAQKRFAEEQCRNEWLLNIDADEVVTPPLRNEIEALFADGEPEREGYRFKIRFMFAFETKPARWAQWNAPVRLYDRRVARFRDHTVHDSVIALAEDPPLRIGMLAGEVHHTSFRSLAHVAEKLNSYSTAQAEDLFAKGRKPGVLRVLAEPVLTFLKFYLLRRHFVHGLHGFSYSVIVASMRLMRLAKARELFLLKDKE